jgi:hypothetical protein
MVVYSRLYVTGRRSQCLLGRKHAIGRIAVWVCHYARRRRTGVRLSVYGAVTAAVIIVGLQIAESKSRPPTRFRIGPKTRWVLNRVRT